MDPEQQLRVGRVIKLARIEAGMKQRELADALGVSVTALSQWERGIKQHYSRAEAIALETALGVADHRLLMALGYEMRVITGEHDAGLTAPQRAEVRRFVDWLRFRDR